MASVPNEVDGWRHDPAEEMKSRMTNRQPTDNLHRRLSRRYWLLLCAAVASMLVGVVLVPALRHLGSIPGVAAITGTTSFLGCIIAALILSRCPFCGWPLYLTKTRSGIPWHHPWLQKVCSRCQRDLTKPIETPE